MDWHFFICPTTGALKIKWSSVINLRMGEGKIKGLVYCELKLSHGHLKSQQQPVARLHSALSSSSHSSVAQTGPSGYLHIHCFPPVASQSDGPRRASFDVRRRCNSDFNEYSSLICRTKCGQRGFNCARHLHWGIDDARLWRRCQQTTQGSRRWWTESVAFVEIKGRKLRRRTN